MKKLLLIFLSVAILIGCKKDDKEKNEIYFEVECAGCSVVYTNNETGTEIKDNIDNSFKFTYYNDIDFELSIRTTNTFKISFWRITQNTTNSFYSKSYTKNTNFTYSSLSKKVNDGSSDTGGGGNTGGYGCGLYNGKSLYLGPKGGCYYYNSNGNKTYVDRGYCKCN